MTTHLYDCVIGGTERLHVSNDPGVFTPAACLLPVPVVEADLLVEGFPERDFGLAHDHWAVVLAGHPLAVDLQVELTHARCYGLLHVVVEPNPEMVNNDFWKLILQFRDIN